MNRLQQAIEETDPLVFSSTHSRIDQAKTSRVERTEVDYSLFMPMHYEKNYAYPLLVWLHSEEDDERQLERIMPLISMRNYVGVAPRANLRCQHCNGFEWSQDPLDVATAHKSVINCIDLASQRTNINPNKIFLCGYGSGGTMAFRIATRNPEKFAGVLSIGGGFPEGDSPLSNLNRCRKLPLFLAQGRDAIDYPVDQMCRDLRLFHIGGFSVTLRQYPCGDELTSQMLSDMNSWVMEAVTGVRMHDETDESEVNWNDRN